MAAAAALIGKLAFTISGAWGDFNEMINQPFKYQSYDKTTKTFSYIGVNNNNVVVQWTTPVWYIIDKKSKDLIAYRNCSKPEKKETDDKGSIIKIKGSVIKDIYECSDST